METATKPLSKTAGRRQAEVHAPFYCAKRKTRKSAWETPEYLTNSDKTLIKLLFEVRSATEFADLVYEHRTPVDQRHGYAEAFFYRVIGWPEGRSYMATSERYREWSFPIVKKQIDAAYRAVYTKLPGTIRALRDEYVASGRTPNFWVINDGLCDEFARDVEDRLKGDFEGYNSVANGNFMMGADGDPDGDDVWDPKVLAAFGGTPRDWTIAQLNGISFGGHVWLTDGVLHFDAECPEGVSCLFDLPIFKRYITDSVLNAAKAA